MKTSHQLDNAQSTTEDIPGAVGGILAEIDKLVEQQTLKELAVIFAKKPKSQKHIFAEKIVWDSEDNNTDESEKQIYDFREQLFHKTILIKNPLALNSELWQIFSGQSKTFRLSSLDVLKNFLLTIDQPETAWHRQAIFNFLFYSQPLNDMLDLLTADQITHVAQKIFRLFSTNRTEITLFIDRILNVRILIDLLKKQTTDNKKKYLLDYCKKLDPNNATQYEELMDNFNVDVLNGIRPAPHQGPQLKMRNKIVESDTLQQSADTLLKEKELKQKRDASQADIEQPTKPKRKKNITKVQLAIDQIRMTNDLLNRQAEVISKVDPSSSVDVNLLKQFCAQTNMPNFNLNQEENTENATAAHPFDLINQSGTSFMKKLVNSEEPQPVQIPALSNEKDNNTNNNNPVPNQFDTTQSAKDLFFLFTHNNWNQWQPNPQAMSVIDDFVTRNNITDPAVPKAQPERKKSG